MKKAEPWIQFHFEVKKRLSKCARSWVVVATRIPGFGLVFAPIAIQYGDDLFGKFLVRSVIDRNKRPCRLNLLSLLVLEDQGFLNESAGIVANATKQGVSRPDP